MKGKRLLSMVLICVLISQACLMVVGAAGNYAETPRTQYGRDFIAACEGQQWFINEIERQLNAGQKTITRLQDGDLSVIFHLGFTDKNLSGVIPRAIGWLVNLETLSLGGNNFSNIPAAMFSLQKLSHIDLSNNAYAMPIPHGFGGMPALKVLILAQNAFTGDIPKDILQNTRLTGLDLSHNNLYFPISLSLNGMTGLKYLSLSCNALACGFPDLSGMTNLETLSLWGTGMKGDIHASLFTLTNLEILDLAENDLYGPFDYRIANLTNLKLLSIGDNENLGGEIPQAISSLTELWEIDLANCGLIGTIPDAFYGMNKLREVHLEQNYLRGYVPDSLVDRQNNAGAEIYLNDNYLTGKGVIHNENNFYDYNTPQYYLTLPKAITISKTGFVDLSGFLENAFYGSDKYKPLLSPQDYTYRFSLNAATYLEISGDGNLVKAKQDFTTLDNVMVTIEIMGNFGSSFSTATAWLTTDGKLMSISQLEAPPAALDVAQEASKLDNPILTVPVAETASKYEPYISGYPNGEFKATENVTREQTAKMLSVALALAEPNEVSRYGDVGTSDWSSGYIEAVSQKQLFTGYADGSFRPAAQITRAEFVAVVVRAAELSIDTGVTVDALPFSDITQAWYLPYLKAAVTAEFIHGYADGTFRPNQPISRSEAVKVINTLLGVNLDQLPADLSCSFSDVAESHWAYRDIIAASTAY